jgi:hypothetical protein
MPPEDCIMQYEIYLSDLEIWLHDKLRDQPFYPLLRRIDVAPSHQHRCGWAARISGDLTSAQQAWCAGIVRAMQRRYDLTTKQDFHPYVAAESTEQVNVRSMKST